ncbi:B-4DMT family transporter [Nocardia suismassiliense]|uniref:B-4DMT family transporter n=1 Tax=Nocardia suismassiliense TaxID=2077092 RepID=UPI000D1E3773|nr:B-4DMT family transporter [Nocardia suismassiliense]
MKTWVLRAAAIGALILILRAALGFATVHWPTQAYLVPPVCLFLLLTTIGWWGTADGRADRPTQLDLETGSDLTIPWLKTAAAAGFGSGLVAWILDRMPGLYLGDYGIVEELTGNAAFLTLLILTPALLGVAVGRMLAGRRRRTTSDLRSARR